MSVLKVLHLNNQKWEVKLLAENVYLLETPHTIRIEDVHQTALHIEKKLGKHLNDIVIAYQSITLFTTLTLDEWLNSISNLSWSDTWKNTNTKVIKLPICYDYGTDMQQVAAYTRLTKEKIINIHLEGTYRSVMIGFIPGFVYADGLDPRLYCPRKKIPDKYILSGSVGIGGNQTGIYPTHASGGWQVIGRTPVKLFNPQKEPPTRIPLLSYFKFYPIAKETFDQWEK